jgi:hypothetical protein
LAKGDQRFIQGHPCLPGTLIGKCKTGILLNGDGEKDLLVTYIIGSACFEDGTSPPGTCGNHHEEFLAVFLEKKGTYNKPVVKQVGGRNVRVIEGISARDSTIILDTLEYDNEDPSCCPGKPGKLRLVLKDDALIERK